MAEQYSHRYDDIINREYPLREHDRIRHPAMPMSERAKIFSPFAALKGYEEAIDEQKNEAAIDRGLLAEAFEED